MNNLKTLPFLLLLLVISPVFTPPAKAADCAEDVISVHCGQAPSATFDDNGILWVTFVQDRNVYVARSTDTGAHFETAVRVTPVHEDAEFNGENRPKIIVSDSNIFVSWTTKSSTRFTGNIRFSRSIDGGRGFTSPKTVNDDNLLIGHRFESMMLTESGNLYLAWLDKRDHEAAAEGNNYAGAAVYYAVSSDLGVSFSENRHVSAHSCECCRIAMAAHGPDEVAIFWRQLFTESIRDHAFTVLTPAGDSEEIFRATHDDWYIDACPHHGPAMAASRDDGDSYHISWFSNGNNHQGTYYARFSLVTGMPEDVQLVDATPGAGHPALAGFDDTVFLVWKGFDGSRSLIRVIRSIDNGHTWSVPETIAITVQGSDHPLVITGQDGVYLSWKSEEFGYVFKRISDNTEG